MADAPGVMCGILEELGGYCPVIVMGSPMLVFR